MVYPISICGRPVASVVVATTRPETMLGDTAVAVHPEDKRYQHFAGRRFGLPITDRVVPLLFDSYVDQTFGTGALKITPGHDFNDFEIGDRFGLDRISIFDADARIDSSAFNSRGEKGDWTHRYNLKDRIEARKLIVAELKDKGFLEKAETYRHAVGRCYRCQTVVEPYLTPQWFVNIKPLAEPAIQAVREAQDSDHPGRLEQLLFCVDGEYQRLVYFTADLVGASDTRLVLRRVRFKQRHSWKHWRIFSYQGRPAHRGSSGAKRLSTMRRKGIDSGSGRFGYLVFFRPMALFNPGLAP